MGNIDEDKRMQATLFICILIIVILVATLGIILLRRNTPSPSFAYAAIVPETKEDLVKNKQGELELVSDISIFDLTQWRKVPEEKVFKERVSPAMYKNVLRVIKRKPITTLYAHYETSGYGIDLQCISHKHKIALKKPSDDPEHNTVYSREYAVEIDISAEPLNQPFTVIVNGIYWNGFRTVEANDASTYTDKSVPSELGLIVVFPDHKLAKIGTFKIFDISSEQMKKMRTGMKFRKNFM